MVASSGRFEPGARLGAADLAFASLAAVLLTAVAVGQHLSADGVHYLVTILESGDFVRTAWSRQFANYLTQWPVVVGVRAGVRDVASLSALYGLSIVVPAFVAYVGIRRLVKTGRVGDLVVWSYLTALTTILLPSGALLSGEHQTVVPLAWLLLARLESATQTASRHSLDWIALVSAFGLARSYEAAIGVSIVLLFLAIDRPHRAGSAARFAVPLAITAGIGFAAWAIWKPWVPANRGFFLAAVADGATHPLFLLALSGLLAYFAGCRWPARRSALVALVAVAILLVILRSFDAPWSGPGFAARTLVAWWAPALLAATAWRLRRGGLAVRAPRWAAALVVSIGFASLPGSAVWRDLTIEIRRVQASTESRFVRAAKHRLTDHPAAWFWTFPELSLVLAEPCERTVLLNPPGGWQPFDPRAGLPLGRYRENERCP